PGAVIIDKDTKPLVAADTGTMLTYAPPAPDLLNNVGEDEPEMALLPEQNYFAAVIRLRGYTDTFLYLARPVDPHVVSLLKQTQAGAADYAAVEARRLGIQVSFALMFAV